MRGRACLKGGEGVQRCKAKVEERRALNGFMLWVNQDQQEVENRVAKGAYIFLIAADVPVNLKEEVVSPGDAAPP